VVDKPAAMTSHDVVDAVRRELRERRVGHAGTLDPDATGVLLVGVGNLTRGLRFLQQLPKTYTGEVVLGVETTTLDASGEVTATHEMHVEPAAAQEAAARLTGDILQVPPMVSALKVGGRRLHELAREGVEVERAPRPVTVYRFDVAATADPAVLAVEVVCSSGTYVRTLAADLGHLLGGGAHLRNLRRTAIGSFAVAEASVLGSLVVLPPAEGLRDLATVTVDDATEALVRRGSVLPAEAFAGEGPWRVLSVGGELLAVYEPFRGQVKPAVVFPP
jgi:tRNA pseudouridine55 synthase